MKYNFKRPKKKVSSGAEWTACGDLFMVLALVFLFNYVLTGFRAGTYSHTGVKLEEQIQTIQQQLEVFQKGNAEYLTDQSSEKDQKRYFKLWNKMSLLSDKEKLKGKQLKQELQKISDLIASSDAKKQGLNEYQQMIKQLINDNIHLKNRVVKNAEKIQEASSHYAKVSKRYDESKHILAQKNWELKESYKIIDQQKVKQQVIEKNYKEKIDKLTAKSNSKISDLTATIDESKRKYKKQIAEYDQEIKNVKNKLKNELDAFNLKASAEKEKLQKQLQVYNDTIKSEKNKYNTLTKKVSKLNQSIEKRDSMISDLSRKISSKEKDLAKISSDWKHKQIKYQAQLATYSDQLSEEKQKFQQEFETYNSQVAAEKKRLTNQLNNYNKTIQAEKKKFGSLVGEVANLKNALSGKDSKISDLKKGISEKEGALASVSKQWEKEQGKYDAQLAAYSDKLKQEKEKYQKELQNHNAKVAEEKKKLTQQLQTFNDAIQAEKAKQGGLKSKVSDLTKTISDKDSKISELTKKIADKEKKFMRKLASATKQSREREKLAAALKKSFKKNKLKAKVDKKSGDIIIDFGKEHFEKNSFTLKPGMKRILKKLIPVYAKTLLSNSHKVNTIEIIGFASPTYRGMIIDPTSIETTDQTAINYNLDLSYKRARSIFKYIMDKKTIVFDYQQKMLPLMKITGRSYFTENIQFEEKSDLNGRMPAAEFCPKLKCARSQRVIIKFYLDK